MEDRRDALRLTAYLSPPSRIADSPSYKWWVYGAVAIGLAMTVMDQSGLNIALPQVADYFEVDIPTIQWITLGYVLSTSVMLMPMGRLADIVGRKQVFVGGLVVFMCMAVVGGTSQGYLILIAAKLVQGAGAAAIQGNSMAMVTEAFPERERGKAIGMYMTIIGTGSISGPIVGGLLVSSFGWRSVFFASLPVGAVAIATCLVVLKGQRPSYGTGSAPSFDWIGAGLSSGALISFLLAMTNGYRIGWSSPPIAAGFAAALVLLLALFLWWERRTTDPILDLDLFRSRMFSLAISARALSFLSGSSIFFLMPFYIVQVLGYPASRAALMMVPGSIGMAVIGPLSGRLSDRVGTRWPAVLGLALSAASLAILSQLEVDSHWSHVAIAMVLSGSGFGFFSSPNTSAVMGAVPRQRYGIVSAFLNLTRTGSNVIGIAAATTIVSVTMVSMGYAPVLGEAVSGSGGTALAFVSGFKLTFLLALSGVGLALVLTLMRGASRPSE